VRNREIVGLAAVATAALIFSFAAPSFGQEPSQNPGALAAKGKGKGKGKQRPPSRPTPHGPDGHVLLGPLPGEGGVWNGNAGATIATNVGRGLDNNLVNLPTNLKIPDVPFQDWARALYDSRQANNTADDPHVRCKSSGGPRLYHTPYGFEIVDIPELERIYIMGVGGPHTWRVVYMDGRERPKDIDPSFHGY